MNEEEFLAKYAEALALEDKDESFKRTSELIQLQGRDRRLAKQAQESHIKATTWHTKAEIDNEDD